VEIARASNELRESLERIFELAQIVERSGKNVSLHKVDIPIFVHSLRDGVASILTELAAKERGQG
jgi:hypothetical protein